MIIGRYITYKSVSKLLTRVMTVVSGTIEKLFVEKSTKLGQFLSRNIRRNLCYASHKHSEMTEKYAEETAVLVQSQLKGCFRSKLQAAFYEANLTSAVPSADHVLCLDAMAFMIKYVTLAPTKASRYRFRVGLGKGNTSQ